MDTTYKEAAERLSQRVGSYAQAVGQVVKATLEARRWVAMDLIYRSGLSSKTIYNLLDSEPDNPRLDTLVRLAAAFEMPMQEFMAEVEREASGVAGSLDHSNAHYSASKRAALPVLASLFERIIPRPAKSWRPALSA